MGKILNKNIHFVVVAGALCLLTAACLSGEANSNSPFFGKVEPPRGQVLRYITGSEPESLDPHLSTGQPEARIYMALYEGLTEYHPVTMEPIPAIAERWEVNSTASEFTFYLRRNARWSNGDPINAQDVLYSFRRALAPQTASRSAYMAYYIKYAQGYNEGGMFVRDPRTSDFLLEKDVTSAELKTETTSAVEPLAVTPLKNSTETPTQNKTAAQETPFYRFIHSPARVIVAGDETARAKEMEANPKLKAALEGQELVPVKAEDIGIEAVDDYTVRITLIQPAPYFIGMIAHQLFRLVPRQAIEKYGAAWTDPAHIVTCGPFKMKSWKPYNELVVVKDPMYWDTANVKLEQISFYPLDEATTMLNLYKAGQVDATYNHTVPLGWVDILRTKQDYMDAPEVAIEYYMINTEKPPMDDKRVRKAFNMAIDKQGFADYAKTYKPLTAFSPEGIFPGYPQPKGDEFNPERARQLLAEAGYKDASGKYDPSKFPIRELDITYNTIERNRQTAEFVQNQWKQHLGLTVTIRNMEWKTYLQYSSNKEYKGFARAGWIGDYMDPYTFLNLFSTDAGDNGTGWWEPKYVEMLSQANYELDPQKRFALLAKAEAYLLEEQPVIPLGTAATNWVKKPYVKGMYPNPQTMHPWKFVYIEYDTAKWDQGLPKSSEFPPVVKAED